MLPRMMNFDPTFVRQCQGRRERFRRITEKPLHQNRIWIFKQRERQRIVDHELSCQRRLRVFANDEDFDPRTFSGLLPQRSDVGQFFQARKARCRPKVDDRNRLAGNQLLERYCRPSLLPDQESSEHRGGIP